VLTVLTSKLPFLANLFGGRLVEGMMMMEFNVKILRDRQRDKFFWVLQSD
jgi:hypothetical protein